MGQWAPGLKAPSTHGVRRLRNLRNAMRSVGTPRARRPLAHRLKMRPVMKLAALVLTVLIPSTVFADADRAVVGTDVAITRYGTSHETVNVLSIEPAVELRATARLYLGVRIPVATTFVHRNACCGYGLGNATRS